MKRLVLLLTVLIYSPFLLATDHDQHGEESSPIVLKGVPTQAPKGAPVLDAAQAAQGQATQLYPPANAPTHVAPSHMAAPVQEHHEAPAPSHSVTHKATSKKAASHKPKAVEQAKHTKAHAESHTAAAHHPTEGVSPQEAHSWLQNGNTRFRKGWFRKDGKSPADVKRLAEGQKPHSIVLSCSDSRVPPELVFDQALGEIFTVRTAGEALDDNVVASIEYAVEHLGTRLIVVMGHTQCGAVKAAISAKDGQSVGSPALDALVADIKPRLPAYAHATKDVGAESSENAKGVAEELIKRSKIIAEKVNSGEVKIESAIYRLDSGKVDWL